MTSEPIATLEHARAAHFCARGMRAFAARHGLDWEQLRTEGVPVSTLEATGDALAMAVAAKAREAADHG
jgi:hypothetical protein